VVKIKAMKKDNFFIFETIPFFDKSSKRLLCEEDNSNKIHIRLKKGKGYRTG
jgi:hypothetical protein